MAQQGARLQLGLPAWSGWEDQSPGLGWGGHGREGELNPERGQGVGGCEPIYGVGFIIQNMGLVSLSAILGWFHYPKYRIGLIICNIRLVSLSRILAYWQICAMGNG